jgi:hypothetical protein
VQLPGVGAVFLAASAHFRAALDQSLSAICPFPAVARPFPARVNPIAWLAWAAQDTMSSNHVQDDRLEVRKKYNSDRVVRLATSVSPKHVTDAGKQSLYGDIPITTTTVLLGTGTSPPNLRLNSASL